MSAKDEDGTSKSPVQKKKPGEWTKEEMEKAEPFPMPELDDDKKGSSGKS